MNIEIQENRCYLTLSGKRLKVTSDHDHADEIYGTILNDDGTVVDFFKTNYNGFCKKLKD